jgi:hypothetical protein
MLGDLVTCGDFPETCHERRVLKEIHRPELARRVQARIEGARLMLSTDRRGSGDGYRLAGLIRTLI